MALPTVNINELDNQLGVALPDGDVLCIVGPGIGTAQKNVPQIITRKQDAINAFGQASTNSGGPLAEYIAAFIDQYQTSIVACETDITTVGSYGAVTFHGTGSLTPTAHAATAPFDDSDVQVVFLTAGTVGVAGITYKYSLDGGLTFSASQALGTATQLVIAEMNAAFDLTSTQTVAINDYFTCRTAMPLWNDTQLVAALEAVRVSQIKTDLIMILGPCTPTDFAAIDTEATVFSGSTKERTWFLHPRGFNVGETEAAYLTAQSTAFASSVSASKSLNVGYGDCELLSPIGQHRYRRPSMWAISMRCGFIKAPIDPAYVGLGPLPPGIRVADDNGNPKWHDEFIFPGADDQRFSTLRSWNGRRGTFVGNCRLFTAQGSDFQFEQHRRVMNHARAIVRFQLTSISSQDILVDKNTGFILEEEAASIEASVNAALRTQLVDKRECSAAQFILSRTDNLLSTFTLNSVTRVTPLAYAKVINDDLSFYNPALKAVPSTGV